jgi:type I restriction enzyme S subunit
MICRRLHKHIMNHYKECNMQKISVTEIKEKKRFDATPFVSENATLVRFIDKLPGFTIGSVSVIHKVRNRDSRVYVTDKCRGLMYLSNTHMQKSSFIDVPYMSKKFLSNIEEQKLKKGDIILSAVGTIGQITFVNELLEGAVISGNLLRFTPYEVPGYIYAYLISKYGQANMLNIASGSVQDFITPPKLNQFQIPKLKNQQEIHNLIEEASKLRVQGNNLLKEAIAILESKLPSLKSKNVYLAKISKRFLHNFRLEATYLAESIELFYFEAKKTGATLKSINEISEEVFTPGIFKRIRTNTSEHGIPYLSGSDLLSQMPQFDRFLSKKMKNIEDYVLKDGWLAIQDAGTIGYISLITKYLDGVTATNNLIRIKPNVELNHNYYIFCFFKTSIGQKIIKSLEYGSVQKHIDNHQISAFQIPIYDDVFEQVSEKIKIMHEKLSNACFLEKDAISIVEKEIESWQVS